MYIPKYEMDHIKGTIRLSLDVLRELYARAYCVEDCPDYPEQCRNCKREKEFVRKKILGIYGRDIEKGEI